MMREHSITPSDALKIYNSANGDLNYISRLYDYFRDRNVDNFIGLMIKMVKPGEFNEPKKITKKTKFDNFKGRDYDYNKLEKKLLGWDKEDD